MLVTIWASKVNNLRTISLLCAEIANGLFTSSTYLSETHPSTSR